MVNILFFENPFAPQEHRDFCHGGGVTIRQWLGLHFGDEWEEFGRPTIAILNEQPILRAEWETHVLTDGDVLIFTTLPEGVVAIIVAIVVAVVVAVAVAVLMPTPKVPGQLPNADPAYTLKGQTNQLKLMEPIECVYGACRIWPSYAARPYNLYDGNEQYQFNLYCVGQGEFQIDDILIEDTPLENFQEAEIEIVPPGESVTLFPDNVITSPEVGNIQLFGPNRDEYDGWTGPFVANGPGTQTTRIDLDITFPQGLFVSDEGKLKNMTVQLDFERQAIDDAGNPVGAWVSMGSIVTTRRNNTPQRLTYGVDVAPGRYQVRGQRISTEPTDLERVSASYWEAMRAFLPSTRLYGNATLVAVKIRASNNLNDQSRARFNVYATRKLPQWDAALNDGAGGWTAPVATRSIVWAFCDLFRANYGGRLTDEFLDIAGLLEHHAFYSVQGKHFDWVFDQKITVWEAARAICRVGRAVPMLFGSKIGMVRDRAKTIPTAIFTPDNIVKGSFRNDISLFEPDPVDHIIVEYVDPVTWKPETVVCGLPGSLLEHGEDVKLSGCTSRTLAYREGLYIMAGKRYWRERLTFKTGLEGNIPSFGDLIAVSHDIPRWNASGIVTGLAQGIAPGLRINAPAEIAGFVPWLEADAITPEAGFFSTDPAKLPATQSFWNVDSAQWILRHTSAPGVGVEYRSAATDLVATPSPASATWGAGVAFGGFTLPAGSLDLVTVSVAARLAIKEPLAAVTGSVLLLRNKKGGVTGPLTVEASIAADRLDVLTPFSVGDLLFDLDAAPVAYLLGVNDVFQGRFQVTNLAPAENDTVEVTATNYAPELHTFDNENPPALPSKPTLPGWESVLEVRGIVVTRHPGIGRYFYIIAAWIPTPGAVSYVVETSDDGINWGSRRTVTEPTYTAEVWFAQDFYFRVAAVNVTTGPWTTWNGLVGFATTPPPAVVGVALLTPWEGLDISFFWQPVESSPQYGIRVWETGGGLLREDTSPLPSYVYTLANMLADAPAPVRNITIDVVAINSAGESYPESVLDVTNDPPPVLTGFLSAFDSADATHKFFNAAWNASGVADFSKYRLWGSQTSGFAADGSTLLYEGTATGFLVAVPKEVDGSTLPFYWRASALDVWGDEVNLGPEQTIAATAP